MRHCGKILLCVVLLGCSAQAPISYSGFMDAPMAAVVAQVSGKIARVEVREGMRVKQGQLLAQLDARERTALVAQADANVQRAREALREAERNAQAIAPMVRGAAADIAQRQAQLDDATLELERVRRLLRSGAATTQQLDAAQTRFAQAQAAVASMDATRQATRGRAAAAWASVDTARAALLVSQTGLELARVQLAQTEIRSPFEGLVAEQNLQAGEWAAPGTPVITVEDLGRQWVRIDVEETALGALRIGQAATVQVVSFPGRSYAGHIIEIGAEAEFALNRDVKRGRPDVRTFRVRIGLDQSDEALRPGMTATVRFSPASAPKPAPHDPNPTSAPLHSRAAQPAEPRP